MGRHRVTHTCCIEETVWVDIRLLRAWGFLREGALTTGAIEWRCRSAILSANVRTDLRRPSSLNALIEWRALDGATEKQTLAIDRTRCRFGGWRYYFICPRLGQRCEVLPLLDGEFASRQAHGVTYGSQSEGDLDRAYRLRDKLRGRLEGVKGLRKPTGAKRARLTVRWREAAKKARTLRSDALRRRFGMA